MTYRPINVKATYAKYLRATKLGNDAQAAAFLSKAARGFALDAEDACKVAGYSWAIDPHSNYDLAVSECARRDAEIVRLLHFVMAGNSLTEIPIEWALAFSAERAA